MMRLKSPLTATPTLKISGDSRMFFNVGGISCAVEEPENNARWNNAMRSSQAS